MTVLGGATVVMTSAVEAPARFPKVGKFALPYCHDIGM